jgi:hypothetical protein
VKSLIRGKLARIPRGVTLLPLLCLALAAAGCAEGDDPAGPGPGAGDVTLELEGFRQFAQDEGIFELWISFALTEPGGAPGARHSAATSAGRFRIDGAGRLVGPDWQEASFGVDPSDPDVPVDGDGAVRWQLAVDAFVTIEDPETPSDEPRLAGLLGGSFLNGTAALSTDHPDALNRNFATAAGTALLATPTTADPTDEDQGMWFVQPGGTGPSLSLPAPPSGWVYEGWVQIPQVGPVSLGRFSSPAGADSDGAGPLATTQPWDYPGSDFPFAATGPSLAIGNVVVSLEPEGDEDGSSPFFLSVLVEQIPDDQPTNESFPLTNVAVFPTGTVTIPLTP